MNNPKTIYVSVYVIISIIALAVAIGLTPEYRSAGPIVGNLLSVMCCVALMIFALDVSAAQICAVVLALCAGSQIVAVIAYYNKEKHTSEEEKPVLMER